MARNSMKWELFFVITAISIIPIVIVTLVSYNHYSNLIQKQIASITEITTSNASDEIGRIVGDMEHVTLTFQESSISGSNGQSIPDVLKGLTYREYTAYDLFQSRRSIKFLCETILSGHSYINGIYIFIPGGDSMRYTTGLDVIAGYNPEGSEWYGATIAAKGAMHIGDVEVRDYMIQPQPKAPTIAFSRAIYDAASRSLLGVVMVDCSLDIFRNLNTEIVPGFTDIMLVGEAGAIIYSSNQPRIGAVVPDGLKSAIERTAESSSLTDDASVLVIRRTAVGNAWSIVAEISLEDTINDFAPTRQLIVILPLICVLAFTFVSLFLSGILAKPIVELSKAMSINTKARNLIENKKWLGRNDEIGMLYRQYNQMIIEINDYIKTSYQNRLITLDAQMRSLEAQINAHFLFNTLESINCIAEIEEVDSIARMAKALGDMFKYSIKTKSELVPVKTELDHVRNYLVIQQIRFEDRFGVEFDIEDGLEDLLVLKLILQPIIENSIVHGLSDLRGRGKIAVKGYTEGETAVFEISDNGTGMTQGQLEELRGLLAEAPHFQELGKRTYESIGIKNINSRIQLYYSRDFGLTIAGNGSAGTIVKITVPIRRSTDGA